MNYYWVSYRKRKSVCIAKSEIWKQYTRMCEKFKYTSYPYDTFFNHILTEESGISLTNRKNIMCLKIDKLLTEKWVEIFRNTDDTKIEVWNDDDVDDE